MNNVCTNQNEFSFYCCKWLERQKIRCKQTTYAVYYSNVHNYIIPYFENMHIADIDSGIIFDFSLYLKQNGKRHNSGGLKPSTVNNILTVLNQITKFSEAEYNIHFHKLIIMYLRQSRPEISVMSRYAWYKLQNYLIEEDDNISFGILLSMYTGMRIGELCALQWKDISDDGIININKTVQRIRDIDYVLGYSKHKTKVIIEHPKTISSVRYVPLSSYLIDMSLKFRNDKENYIITGTSKYMEPRTLQYRFKQILKKLSLPDYNFHILRHTFATYCMEAKVDIKSLSELLGHSSVKTTLSIYVHSSIELKREYMNAFARNLLN
jgi:integrase